jgi:uncharacterized protein YdhG (YjbR/CyaY superfamily)
MADQEHGGGTFSAQEKVSLKARAAELKAEAKRGKAAERAAAEAAEVGAKIAEMPAEDRVMAERLNTIVATVAPHLSPKLYYGQPGYADGGKVVVFFRSGRMDKLRYSTFGVSPYAALDDPTGLWPTSFALTEPTEEAWERIGDIVRRAAASPLSS